MPKEKRRPRVYVINDAGHNYEGAKKFGTLVYLTRGQVPAYSTTKLYRELSRKMKDAQSNDFILVTSLASLNAVAGWIMGTLGHPLRLLLYKDGKYLRRELFPRLQEEQTTGGNDDSIEE